MSTNPGIEQEADRILAFLAQHPLESFAHEEISYLIEPEIPRGALILVTGKPSSGKSTIVLKWCKDIAESGTPVLYLDRDNGRGVPQERIKRIGGTPANLRYWSMRSVWATDDYTAQGAEILDPPAFDSPMLHAIARKLNNPVIVFDTFGAFFDGGDENDNSKVGAALKPLRALTALGATVIVIHHTSKDPKSNSRGASALEAAVDIAMRIDGTQDDDGLLTTMTVTFFKSRYASKNQTYKLTGGVPYRSSATAQDKLADLLKQWPGLTKDQFVRKASDKGYSRSTVRDFIDGGLARKVIRYTDRKLYPSSPPKTISAMRDYAGLAPLADEDAA